MDDKGMLYVADRYNHRIQKFTPEGDFVAQFAKEGTAEGEWIEPCGIAVDAITDIVYVSSKHKISAFNSTGEFVTEFGREGSEKAEFCEPSGLALDKSTGHLHVCDLGNDRLVSYMY